MPRLFIGNFEFEHRLVTSRKQSSTLWQNLPANLNRINAELATALLALAQDGDSLLLPEQVTPIFFDRVVEDGLPKVRPITIDQLDSLDLKTEIVPWGFTNEVIALAESTGLQINSAPLDKIVLANSRTTAFEFAKELSVLPPHAKLVSSLHEAETAIELVSEYTDQWIMKAEFGMSGRERIMGLSSKLAENQTGWILKRITGGQKIIVEPILINQGEVSWHWNIPLNASPEFLGATELFNNDRGEYRGNRVLQNQTDLISDWSQSFEAIREACDRLKERGYFGPVSIDSMKYILKNGSCGYHSLMDINARYTMGRMALEFQKRLSPNTTVDWTHVPISEDLSEQIDLNGSTRIINTTPEIIGGRLSSRKSFLKIYL